MFFVKRVEQKSIAAAQDTPAVGVIRVTAAAEYGGKLTIPISLSEIVGDSSF
jgi:hypothetical protein